MARYTAQKEFVFGVGKTERALIPDAGASVAVEYWSGAEWVTDSASPVIDPSKIYTLGVNVRLTPTSGGFYIDEEEDE